MIRSGLALLLLVATWAVVARARGRLGALASAALGLLALWAFLELGFAPPVPTALVRLYVGGAAVAAALYLTSSDALMEESWAPLRRLAVDPALGRARAAVVVVLPALAAGWTWSVVSGPGEPPPRSRSVHPAPPGEIDFREPGGGTRTLRLATLQNPHRALGPEARDERVAEGRVVYYENCFYCHGDLLAGDGHYADALDPPPADFTDPAVLPMLQESYLFWRIAKGGPGLPQAGAPWDSAMPAWEGRLTEDEIWSVIDFLYATTGYAPRAVAAER